MKNRILIMLLLAAVGASAAFAQTKTSTVTIKTSAQCEMCKARIEKAMAYEKGVVSSELNLETKDLAVVYKTGKTTPAQIRKALSAVGYDADEVPAVAKAYNALPPCCKKPDDPEHIKH